MTVKLNQHEKRLLEFLADEYSDYYGCYSFAPLMRETGLDRKTVRRACRSLARKGLAEFHRGLWTEDGEPAGSGYGATENGVQAIYGGQS